MVTYKNRFGEVTERYTWAENAEKAKENWKNSSYAQGSAEYLFATRVATTPV